MAPVDGPLLPPTAPALPGSDSPSEHIPVLLKEVLHYLDPQPGRKILDCTLGLAGHAAAIAARLGPTGELWGVDLDRAALQKADVRLKKVLDPPAVRLFPARFDQIESLIQAHQGPRFDGVLADFGVSSMQFDDPARGFSFRHDAPLDMRMDVTQGATAAELLRDADESELARIFYEYGEERKSRQIAAAIVRDRQRAPIATTQALADLCARVLRRGPGGGHDRIHPATRVFQALRIAVNGELAAIDGLLAALPAVLAEGGRAVLISFHSLEDRKVKESLKFWKQSSRCTVETPKPVQATAAELFRNPRARSAKLRALSAWRRSASDAGG